MSKFNDDIGKEISKSMSQLGDEINLLTSNLERQHDVESPEKLPSIDITSIISDISMNTNRQKQLIANELSKDIFVKHDSQSNISDDTTNFEEDENLKTMSYSRDMDDIIEILNSPSKTETIQSNHSTSNKRLMSDFMMKPDGDNDNINYQSSIFSASTLSISPGRNNVNLNNTYSTEGASLANNYNDSEDNDEETITKSKISKLLLDYSSRYAKSNIELDKIDEWENDDDNGYLVIDLTEDEFFEMEEDATQALLVKKNEKSQNLLNRNDNNNDNDEELSLDGGSEVYEDADSMAIDISHVENILVR